MRKPIKSFIWFIFLIALFTGAFASQLPVPIFQIDIAAQIVAVDNLDNVYLVTVKNELIKYTNKGKLLWRYSNKSFGKISQLDVSDPMRIVVFYSISQQIMVLNNNLSEISRFSFSRDFSQQVSLAASANNNGYWIFDQNNRELLRLSTEFITEQRSGNLYQQTAKNLQPDLIRVSDQNVYLHDATQGILQFDRFGAYLKTIKTDSLANFQVKADTISYLSRNSIKKMSVKTGEFNLVLLPVKSTVLQYCEGNKITVLLTEKMVVVYLK